VSQCSWLPSTPARELIFVEPSICTTFLDRKQMKEITVPWDMGFGARLDVALTTNKGRNLACNTLVAVFMLEARQGMECYSRAIHVVNNVAGNRISKRLLCKDQYLCPPHFPRLEELTRTHLITVKVPEEAWTTLRCKKGMYCNDDRGISGELARTVHMHLSIPYVHFPAKIVVHTPHTHGYGQLCISAEQKHVQLVTFIHGMDFSFRAPFAPVHSSWATPTHIKQDCVGKHVVFRYLQAVGKGVDDVTEATTDEEHLFALGFQGL